MRKLNSAAFQSLDDLAVVVHASVKLDAGVTEARPELVFYVLALGPIITAKAMASMPLAGIELCNNTIEIFNIPA